ncbi:sensor histidine kinase [Thermomonas hydrothermalis]|uniref:histidine kinase n=1 Tax=Thermomonas hydrothermalis TaxID=213588 RepID=A0A1M4W1G3_9GAMM|nr:HAMP domain-containing sensor histidine kinase [Thermomonas hydrothermalis]MCL6619203.1 HAMP domain-containing histidine kinase [Thermomonas hydrothermalis]SHE75046.1 Signal transduction histidine kinase [Thermomonas hydrothermalis]
MPSVESAGAPRRSPGRRRLRTRIIVSFVLLGFGLTALFAVAMVQLRNRLENQLIEKTLQREVDNLVRHVETNPDEPPYYLVFDARTFSDDNAYKINPLYRNLTPGVHEIREPDASGAIQVYKVAVRRGISREGKPFTSLVRYNVTDAAATSDRLTRWLLVTVLAFTLFALVLGWWSAARVMAPVSDLAQRLRRSGTSSDPELLAPHFAEDEVGELAKALDDYAARLTEVVQRDREFNADVSHELRTPLAVIRGAVELLLAKPDLDDRTRARLLRIQRAEQQCSDLIGALLLLSRNERGVGQCDVTKVAQHLLDSHRAQLGGKPVQLRLEGEATCPLDVPESALAVALGNLIGNAVKYTPSGEVVVRVHKDAVEVIDTGPGLSAEDAARLFERGYRGTHAGHSQGGGIGLSIVRRLCALYGWEVQVRPGEHKGVVAILRFC